MIHWLHPVLAKDLDECISEDSVAESGTLLLNSGAHQNRNPEPRTRNGPYS